MNAEAGVEKGVRNFGGIIKPRDKQMPESSRHLFHLGRWHSSFNPWPQARLSRNRKANGLACGHGLNEYSRTGQTQETTCRHWKPARA